MAKNEMRVKVKKVEDGSSQKLKVRNKIDDIQE